MKTHKALVWLADRSLGDLTQRQVVGEFEIRRASHAPAAIETLLAQHAFSRLKLQKCFVGDDRFLIWVTHKDS